MLIQLDWLKEYVEFDLSPEDLGHQLTMGGLEVEGLERVELPGGRTTPVFEINVTPNRGYCLSHLGVAREVAALLGVPCRLPDPEAKIAGAMSAKSVADALSVENLEPELCPRYSGMVIENVTIQPSPSWLQDRLTAVGLRPINNVVDVTNFVLMEYGQPLHAFDREKLEGAGIVVRRARAEEPFAALDGTELKLGTDALVIADSRRPVALAGIMGGAHSEVSGSTKHLVLESACFDPVTVRQGSKKYGLRSDSSMRFERGVDIEGVLRAQERAALLIREVAGGAILNGRVDVYPTPRSRPEIVVRVDRVNQVLGTTLEKTEIEALLVRLGMDVKRAQSGPRIQVEVPSFRPGLSREIDLIEEIARLHGYSNIAVFAPRGTLQPVSFTPKQSTVRKVKEALRHQGFAEAINYSFISQESAGEFRSAFGEEGSGLIGLSNPISSDMGFMRTSLVPGLLDSAARNLSRGQKPVKLFELGTVFRQGPSGKGREEKTALAALVMGPYEHSPWKTTGKDYDFYDLKGALESVLSGLCLQAVYSPSGKSFLQQGRSVDCRIGARDVGYLGELAAPLARPRDFNYKCHIFELDLDAVVGLLPGKPGFASIPRFPETYRDISVLVDKSVSSKMVSDLILQTGAPLLQRVELYDHFEGKNIDPGKKSLTFSLTFQSLDRTLTDDEVTPLFNQIVQTLAEKRGAKLRE